MYSVQMYYHEIFTYLSPEVQNIWSISTRESQGFNNSLFIVYLLCTAEEWHSKSTGYPSIHCSQHRSLPGPKQLPYHVSLLVSKIFPVCTRKLTLVSHNSASS